MTETETPIAYPGKYSGPGVHQKAFGGTRFGVVFEDDGETGYFYATTEKFDILDALHLYNSGDSTQPRIGEPVFFVWHPSLLKAGILYQDKFQAVIDFRNKKACCRTGLPSRSGSWCISSHDWDDRIAAGLEP